MAFCSKCGAQVEDGTGFCPSCGAPIGTPQQGQQQYQQPQYQAPPQYYQTPVDDVSANKGMAVLAYIGILVLIPIFAAKNSPFARYHSNQGLVLFIAEVAYSILKAIIVAIFAAISYTLGNIFNIILGLASIAFLVFAIMGIVNAARGEAKPIPLFGGITILK